jgi:hypothetical protein
MAFFFVFLNEILVYLNLRGYVLCLLLYRVSFRLEPNRFTILSRLCNRGIITEIQFVLSSIYNMCNR